MKSGKKIPAILKTSLRLVLAAACLAYILYFFITNKDTVRAAFSLKKNLLAAIIALQIVYLVLQSWRFQLVIEKYSNAKLPFLQFLRIFILGRFLNLLCSQAGNVYRGVQLKKNYGVSYTRYIGSFAWLTWMDCCMNFAIAIVVILALDPAFAIGKCPAWKLLSLILVILIILPTGCHLVLQKTAFNNKALAWVHSKLSEVMNTAVVCVKDPAFLLKQTLLGIIILIRTCAAFAIYFLCFGISVNTPAMVIFNLLFKLGSYVSLTPGNMGVQELAWGYISEKMNIGMAEGILVSALARVFSTGLLVILGAALGGIGLLRDRRKYLPQSGDIMIDS